MMATMNGAGAGGGEDLSATAAADLVLLQQNLSKGRRVTTRMTGLLTSFDDRLARLEKGSGVVPIHRATKDLSKLQRNVEAALLAVDAVLGTNDLVDREQDVLMRDPKEDLMAYQASLTRLKAAMESMERNSNDFASNGFDEDGSGRPRGKEREGTLGRMKGLIELGCQNLSKLFLDYVQSASPKPGWTDVTTWDSEEQQALLAGPNNTNNVLSGPIFPTLMPKATIESLVSILQFLRTILGPSSSLEADMLHRGYGEKRGMFFAATLNHIGREVVNAVEVQTRGGMKSYGAPRLPVVGRRGLARFLDAMFAMAKSEHALAGKIFDKAQANRVYSFILSPGLTILSGVGAQINSSLKKTLTTAPASVGLAFACYLELSEPGRAEVFEDWIKSRLGKLQRMEHGTGNELTQLCHAFRASCLRSLPEYIEDIRAFPSRPSPALGGGIDTQVAPIASTTLQFVKNLLDYPDACESLLGILGEGNWLPQQQAPKTMPNRNTGSMIFEDGSYHLLSRYLSDVVQALFTALEARSRSIASLRSTTVSSSAALSSSTAPSAGQGGNAGGNSTAPLSVRQASGLAAMFHLNNMSYLRREVLLNSSIPDYLVGGSSGSGGSAAKRVSSASSNPGSLLGGYDGPAGGGGSSAGGGGGGVMNVEDELNRRNRSCRTSYLEVFSPLVSVLMDAGEAGSHSGASGLLKNAVSIGGNTEKKDTKDRFARFNDALEEVESTHRFGRIDRSPENLEFRERLKDEVVRMCVPTYTAFVRKHDGFSKNPSKHVRVDPAGLQARLERLFE